MRRFVGAAAAAAMALAGCILSTSLSDLSGGADDAGADAATPPAPPSGGDGASGTDAAPDATIDADAAVDAAPPITFVQATGAAADGGTASVTFPAPVAAHDAILLAFDVNPSTVNLVSVTDTQGDTFQTIIGPWNHPKGIRQYVALALDAKGGVATTTVTANYDAPFTYSELYVHEYANVGAFDTGSAANGTTTGIDGISTMPIAATTGSDLLFAFAVSIQGQAQAGSGFQARSTFHSNVTEDMLLGPAGTYTPKATLKTGVDWMIVGATLKPR